MLNLELAHELLAALEILPGVNARAHDVDPARHDVDVLLFGLVLVLDRDPRTRPKPHSIDIARRQIPPRFVRQMLAFWKRDRGVKDLVLNVGVLGAEHLDAGLDVSSFSPKNRARHPPGSCVLTNHIARDRAHPCMSNDRLDHAWLSSLGII